MSLSKRINSFRYAFKGITILFAEHANARIHLLAAAAATAAGFYFNISAREWIAIVLCIVLVVSLEAVNSSLEYLTDLVSPDHHPLAGKAKDVAAAAVLIAAIGSVIVGLLIFVPKFSGLLG